MIEIPALESERGGCPHPEAETAEIKWIYLTESIIENESLGYKLVSKIRALPLYSIVFIQFSHSPTPLW